ncbi:MAG: hypothetical protein Kow00127_12730 [Bacteroidales bacterium]
MSEKKDKIVESALQLFATEGFHATSTSRVARKAGVSEGLIFRHFGNKAGLLDAILKEGEAKFKNLVADIVMETDPREVIRKTVTMTSRINKDEFDFWKLQYKLKWELEIAGDEKLEPLEMALANAFKKLGYPKPDHEARLLLTIIEGVSSFLLRGSMKDVSLVSEYLIGKYQL